MGTREREFRNACPLLISLWRKPVLGRCAGSVLCTVHKHPDWPTQFLSTNLSMKPFQIWNRNWFLAFKIPLSVGRCCSTMPALASRSGIFLIQPLFWSHGSCCPIFLGVPGDSHDRGIGILTIIPELLPSSPDHQNSEPKFTTRLPRTNFSN